MRSDTLRHMLLPLGKGLRLSDTLLLGEKTPFGHLRNTLPIWVGDSLRDRAPVESGSQPTGFAGRADEQSFYYCRFREYATRTALAQD